MDPWINVSRHRADYRPAEHRDFGVVDARGRKVGAVIYRYTLTIAELPVDDWDSGLARRSLLGTWYAVTGRATRDGEEFGSGHPERLFATEAEREAYIAKHLAGARKRAESKVAA